MTHGTIETVWLIRSRARVAAGVLAAACLCASLASAQGASVHEQAGKRRRAPTARVTAPEMGELPEDPSSFTTVLETREFEGEHKGAEELLSRSVGVQVRRFGGPGQLSEISIRGSTSQQVVVLLDGVRLNTAQSGSVDLSSVPLDLIERIEISRGGGAVQAGSDAVGGVVNLVTRRAGPEPRTAASFSVGSFGTVEGSVSYARRLGQREVALGYQGFRSQGDFEFRPAEFRGSVASPPSAGKLRRSNNRSESHAGFLRLSRSLSDALRLELSNHAFFVSRGQPGLDSGAEGNGGQSLHAHERRFRSVSDVSLVREGEKLRSELRAFFRHERSRFRDPEPALGPAIDSLNRNSSAGGRLGLEREAEWLGLHHTASLQFELRRDTLRSNEFESRRRWVFGAFFQDELSLWDGRLRLIPALRFDRSGGFGSEWLPRLGLVVSPRPWLRLKANAERSYRVPNFDELFFPDKGFIRGNPGLVPEEAFTADVGLELAVARWGPLRELRFELSGFISDIENSIVFQRVSPFTVQATNTRDARVRGIELAFSATVLDWIGVSGNWTRLDAEVERSAVGSLLAQPRAALPGRAENEFSLRLRLGPESGSVKLVLERHHTSKIPTSFSGDSFVGGRTVYDASLSVDLARLPLLPESVRPRRLSVSLSATNLGDRSVRDAIGFPQPGRALTFAVASRW